MTYLLPLLLYFSLLFLSSSCSEFWKASNDQNVDFLKSMKQTVIAFLGISLKCYSRELSVIKLSGLITAVI